MARSWKDDLDPKVVGDNLEPYRRLVELQRQMIELAEQHEETRRRRDALQEQMVRENAIHRLDGPGWRFRLQQSAAWLFRQIPGFPGPGGTAHSTPPASR